MGAEPMPLDPRVRRTRRALEEAVLALAEEREFSSITVRDITARAEINRVTFYLHYKDKEDVCARALDTLFDELTAEDRAIAEAGLTISPEFDSAGYIAQLRHVQERPELYRRLLSESGSMGFASRLRAYYERNFLLVWTNMGLTANEGSAPVELRAALAGSVGVAGLIWWLESGRSIDAEKIAAWSWTFARPYFFEDVTIPESK
jgi:AcrR family transcriptional regulator